MKTGAADTARARPLLAWLALAALVAVALVLLARASETMVRLPVYDWVLYWSAGQLSVQGQDPYARDNLYPFQRHEARALEAEETILFYNPPWSLPLLMLFGLLRNFTLFRIAWGAMLLAAIVFSSDRLWCWYGGLARDQSSPCETGGSAAGGMSTPYSILRTPYSAACGRKERQALLSPHRSLAWVLPFTFLPVLHVIQSGQIGPLVLLGMVGFLYCVRRKRDWAAGAVLLLAAIKPHLVGLFWLALLLWVIEHRRWKVLAGGLVAAAAATAVPLLLNPHLLADYLFTMTHHTPAQQWITPTLGSVLRLVYQGLGLGDDWPALQYVPALGGAVLLPLYYWRHRRSWSWDEQLPVLLFASFVVAPYGTWVADMVVLLLPVLQLAARQARDGRWNLIAIASYLAINCVAGWMGFGTYLTWCFFWMPPALWLVYSLGRCRTGAASLRQAA